MIIFYNMYDTDDEMNARTVLSSFCLWQLLITSGSFARIRIDNTVKTLCTNADSNESSDLAHKTIAVINALKHTHAYTQQR